MKKKIITLAFFLLLLVQGALSQVSRPEFYDFGTNKIPSGSPVVSPWDNVPAEIKKRNSFRRLEWFYRPRMNEQGIFPRDFIEMQKQNEKLKMASFPDTSGNRWTNLGPVGVDFSNDTMVRQWGVVSGRVRGLAIHPQNPDIVYAGAGGGGIWKSTNGGQSWTDKSNGLNMLTFGSISIDPFNPDIIYAGTGEYMWRETERFYCGDGLYKSTNGGENWTKIGAAFGSVTHISSVKVSPHNPNLIMVANTENMQGAMPNYGIWRSADAGLTWAKTLEIKGVYDLAFHPADTSLVYAVSGDYQSQGGFLVSADAGLTFHQSNTGLPATELIGRIQFDISKSDPDYLYVLIHNTIPVSGGMTTCAYKSINGGASWSQISEGVNIAGAADQGWYDLCIAINPLDPNNVFIGNMELSRSVDGSAFTFIRDPNAPGGGNSPYDSYTHVDHHIIRFAPSDPSVMYVGCDGGVFRSANGGQTFHTANNGINSIQLYRVASHNTNPDVIYAGSQDNGFSSTKNRGLTSYALNVLCDGTECFMDYSNSDIIFFAAIIGQFFRSSDGGLTWKEIVPPPDNYDSLAFIAPYWQHPTNPDIIYGCTKQRLRKSVDKGNTWTYTTSTGIVSTPIYSAAQSPVDPDHIMVASRYGTTSLVRSSDGGITWDDITGNLGSLSGGFFMRLHADPFNGNTFYLMKNSYSGALLLKTTDFGTSWTDLTSDLPKVSINDMFIDTANAGVIYIANDFGVYRTTDNGGSWARFGNGLPFIPVLDFSCFSHSGTRLLRVATFGRGVFEYDLNKTQGVEESHSGLAALHAWPNPVSGRLWVDIPAISPDRCTLSLVSVRGSEVASLPVYTTGVQCRTSMDVSGLQPGCYLLVFKGNRELQTCRVVIVK